MFTSTPIQDKEEQKRLCARFGAEYHADDFAYIVRIDKKEAGIITFFIKGKKGGLRQIAFDPEMQDFEVMFISGRAAMEFIDRMGATDSFFLLPDEHNERLTKALGYKKQENGSWYIDTTGFFVEHCRDHKENDL